MGRFLLYRNMHNWLAPNARVLNILASGMKMPMWMDRAMAEGTKEPKTLPPAMINFATAHEIMMIGLDQRDDTVNTFTRVSTHPGVIATGLHSGQAWFMDKVVGLGERILSISVEECGIRQASILAADALPEGKLSYVDAFMMGRKQAGVLQKLVRTELDWLWGQLTELEARWSGGPEPDTQETPPEPVTQES